ncbi:hypothetical protein LXA43DRAFT_1033468 [Ganoderma leucocontextum]|nr:hypothetical protein LXA43DRAFT_1033468 [Ganoderma leucocontextum]
MNDSLADVSPFPHRGTSALRPRRSTVRNQQVSDRSTGPALNFTPTEMSPETLCHPATIQDLPVDVARIVLKHLANDRGAISACTLISRAWEAISRPELFASIGPIHASRIPEFAAFLESRPHLAALIKEIVFSRSRAWQEPPEAPETLSTEHRTSPFIRVLRNLPTLRSLRCDRVHFTPPQDGDIPGPFKLRSLALHACSAGDQLRTSSLFAVLSMFEARTLELTSPYVDVDPDVECEPIIIARPLVCRTLVLRGHSVQSVILPALRQTLQPGCLRKLAVPCATRAQVINLGALVRNFGHNLEHLELDVGCMAILNPRCDDVGWDALNLALCPALTTLSFVVLYGYYDDCHLGHYCTSVLGNILAQLSTTLRDVVIQLIPAFQWSPSSFEEIVDLPTIRRVFLEHMSPRLRAVTLQLRHWKPLEAHCRTLEMAFPELRKSGVLSIEVHELGDLFEQYQNLIFISTLSRWE